MTALTIGLGIFYGVVMVGVLWEIITLITGAVCDFIGRRTMGRSKDSCFGSCPGPQAQAENDCHRCSFHDPCLTTSKVGLKSKVLCEVWKKVLEDVDNGRTFDDLEPAELRHLVVQTIEVLGRGDEKDSKRHP